MRFYGNLSGFLPELSTIDATGIHHWQPELNLQQLTKLQEISGQPFIPNYCNNCRVVKTQNTTWVSQYYRTGSSCHRYATIADLNVPYVPFLSATPFDVRCVNDQETTRCLQRFYLNILVFESYCWKATLTAVNCKCAIGVLTVVLNALAFYTIVTSKRLRQNVSLCLVGNMALSDLITGIYIIAISSYLNNHSFEYIHFFGVANCWKIGILWVLGQAGSVQTTFLLTLERYLVIVHSLNPGLHLSRRMVLFLVAFCWLVALSFVFWAYFENIYAVTFLCIPISITNGVPKAMVYSFFIGSLAMIFFLLSFALYVHIYVVARNTAQSAGVQRESKLAKRIALLVFSNMFFFVFPVLCMSIVSLAITDSMIEYNSNAFRAIMINVFPSLCVSINSCCNPVLHAFRQDQFKAVLRQRITASFNNANYFTLNRLTEYCGAFSQRITGLVQRIQLRSARMANDIHPTSPEHTSD